MNLENWTHKFKVASASLALLVGSGLRGLAVLVTVGLLLALLVARLGYQNKDSLLKKKSAKSAKNKIDKERECTSAGADVLGLDGLLEGARDDVLGQVEELAQVLDALVGQVPVVVLPGEAFGDVAARGQRLQSLDHVQIGHGQLRVLNGHRVLLGHHDALGEQVLVDGNAVLLWHQHSSCVFCVFLELESF
jgi:hypothetical protein